MRVARAAEQAALAQSVGNKRNGVTEEYQIDLSKVPRKCANHYSWRTGSMASWRLS